MLFLTPALGFFSVLILSVGLSMSSHSLFFYWLSLEMNMVSVLPIIVSPGSASSNEAALKYFISQSTASILFLAFYLLSTSSMLSVGLILSTAILFKVGVPPFHSWLASIILLSPYKIIFILLVIQKFIPLHILSCLPPALPLLVLSLLFTVLMLIPVLKNISSIRVTLLASAWGNSCWMVVSCFSSKAWAPFLLFYGLFLASTLSLLSFSGSQKVSSLLSLSLGQKILISLNFLNMAGLPPLSGFFVKLFLLKSFFSSSPAVLIFLLLNTSLVVLFAYFMVSYYLLSSYFQNQTQPHPNLLSGGAPLSVVILFPVLPTLFS